MKGRMPMQNLSVVPELSVDETLILILIVTTSWRSMNSYLAAFLQEMPLEGWQ